MAADLLDPAALLEPVSDDAPCGPDLDLAGDPAFLQATGRIEGMLPSSFFTQDDEGRMQPFDRSRIEIAPALKEIAKLLQATRDIRLLTLSTRLCALNRDLPGLASQFEGIAALLRERWQDVHPQAEGGDYGLRIAILQTLDDAPTVALPFQFMTLLDSRRIGAVTWRAIMTANGEVPVPEGDTPLDRSAVDRAFAEADLDRLRATYGHLQTLKGATDAIRLATMEGAGYENAVTFDKLAATLPKMLATFEQVLAGRDPTLAAPAASEDGEAAPAGAGVAGAPGPALAGGRIATTAQAAAALGAAGRYLRQFEPSSPAELLVRQAGMLVGRSFVDVMRMLVPNLADEAKIGIGADRLFELTFGQLAEVADASSGSESESASEEESWDSSGESEEDAEVDEEAPARVAEPATPPPPVVTTRREALDLLRQISTFYRAAEPASPIPLLLDRAAVMVESDFLTILKDVLPQLVRRDD